MLSNGNDWIDQPVKWVLDYFGSMTQSYQHIAMQIGKILFLIAIIWNCIQMVFSTLEQRKFLVSTITKWFLFLFCLMLLPNFTSGLLIFGNQVVDKLSNGSGSKLNESLGNLYEELSKAVDAEMFEASDKLENLEKSLEKIQEDIVRDGSIGVTTMAVTSSVPIVSAITGGVTMAALGIHSVRYLSTEHKIKKLQERIKGMSESSKQRILNSLHEVLIIDDTNTTKSYKINLAMTAADGSDTIYFSPNAALRLGILTSELLWESAWEKNGEKIKMSDIASKKLFQVIFAGIMAVIMLFVLIIDLIQYVMCIVEYSICSGMCLILVPCLLFDGTKDMANKILPTLFAQVFKLIMIELCLFFLLTVYLYMTMDVLLGDQFGFKMFGGLLFMTLMTFAICSNAPKLAVTLMTGQPQMSMGEITQAAYAIARGKNIASQSIGNTLNKGNNLARGVANFGVNRAGDIGAIAGASKGAFDGVRASGGSKKEAFGAAIGSGLNELGSMTSRRLKGAGSDWMHGGTKSGSAGSSGNNANRNHWENDDPLSQTPDGVSYTDSKGQDHTISMNDPQYKDKREAANNAWQRDENGNIKLNENGEPLRENTNFRPHYNSEENTSGYNGDIGNMSYKDSKNYYTTKTGGVYTTNQSIGEFTRRRNMSAHSKAFNSYYKPKTQENERNGALGIEFTNLPAVKPNNNSLKPL